MERETGECGELHTLYTVARDDIEATREMWSRIRPVVAGLDEKTADEIDEQLEAEDTQAVRRALAELLYVDEENNRLDGPVSSAVGTLLHGFGYAAAHVLFYGAESRSAVTTRLRLAYRTVGVDVLDTESVDGTERTVFRCPYRNVAADRYGERRVCHDILDRVDDGYVTFLERHRDLDYDRPRRCAESDCCHSEVSDG